MKLDLNQILDAVRPKPVVVSFDGSLYTLRRLTVADLATLEALGTPVEGMSPMEQDQRALDTAAGLFDGAAPRLLKVKLAELSPGDVEAASADAVAVISALVTLVVETSGQKKIAELARAAAIAQIQSQKATGTTG